MAYTNGARCTLAVPLKDGSTERVAPGVTIKGDVQVDNIVVKAWITNGVLLVGAPAGDSQPVAQAKEAEDAENMRRAAAAAHDKENRKKKSAGDDLEAAKASSTQVDAKASLQTPEADKATPVKNPWDQ